MYSTVSCRVQITVQYHEEYSTVYSLESILVVMKKLLSDNPSINDILYDTLLNIVQYLVV